MAQYSPYGQGFDQCQASQQYPYVPSNPFPPSQNPQNHYNMTQGSYDYKSQSIPGLPPASSGSLYDWNNASQPYHEPKFPPPPAIPTYHSALNYEASNQYANPPPTGHPAPQPQSQPGRSPPNPENPTDDDEIDEGEFEDLYESYDPAKVQKLSEEQSVQKQTRKQQQPKEKSKNKKKKRQKHQQHQQHQQQQQQQQSQKQLRRKAQAPPKSKPNPTPSNQVADNSHAAEAQDNGFYGSGSEAGEVADTEMSGQERRAIPVRVGKTCADNRERQGLHSSYLSPGQIHSLPEKPPNQQKLGGSGGAQPFSGLASSDSNMEIPGKRINVP